jgi:hypothetical protein
MLCFYFVLLLLCCIIGCNDIDDKIVSVTGVVLVDSQPMDNVSVFFFDVSDSRKGGWGLTNENGKFVLTSHGSPLGSGVVPGQYNVVFEKSDLPKQYNEATYCETIKKFQKNPNFRIPVVFYIPKKYGDPTTSGIAPVTVKETEKNHFEFNLETEKGVLIHYYLIRL